MSAVYRFLGRHPVVVCGLIFAATAWGFWASRHYVLHVVQPREQARRRAELSADIQEGDQRMKRRQYDRALLAYRGALAARGIEIGRREKGALYEKVGLSWMALAEGAREKEQLAQALEAFTAALGQLPLAEDPEGYAGIQSRLGQAHVRLSRVLAAPEHFAQGIAAFEEALKVRTREAQPAGYAELKILIGNAHRDAFAAGPSQKDERMQPALEAYGEALAASAPESNPETHAQARVELGLAFLKLADGVYKRNNTREALAQFERALAIFDRKTHPAQFGRTQRLVGDTYTKMFKEVEISSDTAWRASQVRDQWQEQARRAYELAALSGVPRYSSPSGGTGE